MVRSIRIQSARAYYHVMARENRREDIFHDDDDRRFLLKAGGLKVVDLAKVKGSDPRKVLLADRLWRRTVVSQEWLAEKLEMRSAANVNQQLRRLDGKTAIKMVPDELKRFLEEGDTTNS